MNRPKTTPFMWQFIIFIIAIIGIFLFLKIQWPIGVSIATSLMMIVVWDWLYGSSKAFIKKYISVSDESPEENQNVVLFDESTDLKTGLLALRRLLNANSEDEILDILMQAGLDILGVKGASFVPFNEWSQKIPAIVKGKVPESALQSWSQRLAVPETRQRCKNCDELQGDFGCILFSRTDQSALVRCFTLVSGQRKIGMINFFLQRDHFLNEESVKLFEFIAEAAGQSIHNIHSRDQEIAALQYLQTVSTPKTDFTQLLQSLLENVQQTLAVDFAILYLPNGVPGKAYPAPHFFSYPKLEDEQKNSLPTIPFLEGIWKSVYHSGHSISLENVVLDKKVMWKTFIAVPVSWHNDNPEGVLVLGANNPQTLLHRHQALLETLAGQAALMLQNASLLIRMEYQAVVDERTRLAREIHDGLAQTLAFLKIQAAQMQTLLTKGETDKLISTMQANYRTLSDAYIDARQAIDDLRQMPSDDLRDWIGQVADDFKQVTGHLVNVSVLEFSVPYPIYFQAQLIRIVQEALSNIRKHAEAQVVDILGVSDENSYLIEIRDDGKGFDYAEDIRGRNSHYGLRGMRERAESIGADFQIISKPGMGTRVVLRLPVAVKEGK